MEQDDESGFSCEVLLRSTELGSAGLAGRVALLLTGVGIILSASLRTAAPDAATLHIHLAPLPTKAVAATAHTTKHRRRSLFAGLASWYGDVLDGHTTASGEIFDKDQLTACHPTLPFGTLVRVVNLKNMRSVVVRINDRGVLDPGRVIDLSSAAADRIGMLRAGVAPVRLEVIRVHA